MLSDLKQPGLTQDAMVALVTRGISAAGKKDLEAILDQGTVPLDPSARRG